MRIDFAFAGSGGPAVPEAPQDEPAITVLDAPYEQLDDARKPVRTGLIAGGAFIGLLALFAAVAPLSEAAVTEGEVVTSGDRILIQSERSGLVSRLLVQEGQRVAANQPLVQLNGIRSAAAAEQAQARRDALRAQQARLIAERDGAEAIIFPPDLLARRNEPAAASAMASQQAIFTSHRNVMLADRRIVEQSRSAAEARQASARQQLALIEDELTGIRQLYARGYARKSQLRALERAAAQLQADSAVTSGDVEKSTLESARLASQQMMQTVAELGRVEQELAQVDPALRVRQYDARQDQLRSPVAGRVSGLTRVGQGTVLRGGQTVMEIVPDHRTLIVETRVKPSDIDDVKVGSVATLRFTTVNPHGRSDFEGKVVTLSPAPVADGQGRGEFRAQIAVSDRTALQKAGIALNPGVPVSVQIRGRDRTLMDYLLNPITDAFSRMFREE